MEITLLLIIALVITNLIMAIVFIWGITHIENAVRDDLRRYKEDLM